MATKYTALSLLALSAVMALAACGDGPTGADPADAQAVTKGKALYAEHCASCHGDRLEGQPNWQVANEDGTYPAPPHDDSGHTWHHPDALLFSIVKDGGQNNAPMDFKSAMPAFAGKLSDGQIWSVLSFIKSKWSVRAQTLQAGLNK